MAVKKPTGGITPDDVLDYQQGVEAMYGISITLQLKTSARGTKGCWTVEAIAWRKGLEGSLNSSEKRMVTYPSAHYANFPGAMLGALFALEEALAAQYWLEQMEAQREA